MKKKVKIKAVVFDFDGVLCSDYFYHTLKKIDFSTYNRINHRIFRNSERLINSWMKGEIDYQTFNQIVAKGLGIKKDLLDRELEKSVRAMQLNKDMLKFALALKKRGIKTAILTDNMDVFENILVPYNGLSKYFHEIVSSSQHKVLKMEKNGRLVRILLKKLNVSFPKILVIDDGEKFGKLIKKQKGNFYLYRRGACEKDFARFIDWFEKNFV